MASMVPGDPSRSLLVSLGTVTHRAALPIARYWKASLYHPITGWCEGWENCGAEAPLHHVLRGSQTSWALMYDDCGPTQLTRWKVRASQILNGRPVCKCPLSLACTNEGCCRIWWSFDVMLSGCWNRWTHKYLYVQYTQSMCFACGKRSRRLQRT